MYDISSTSRYNIQLSAIDANGDTVFECCHATATDVLLIMASGNLWLVSIEEAS